MKKVMAIVLAIVCVAIIAVPTFAETEANQEVLKNQEQMEDVIQFYSEKGVKFDCVYDIDLPLNNYEALRIYCLTDGMKPEDPTGPWGYLWWIFYGKYPAGFDRSIFFNKDYTMTLTDFAVLYIVDHPEIDVYPAWMYQENAMNHYFDSAKSEDAEALVKMLGLANGNEVVTFRSLTNLLYTLETSEIKTPIPKVLSEYRFINDGASAYNFGKAASAFARDLPEQVKTDWKNSSYSFYVTNNVKPYAISSVSTFANTRGRIAGVTLYWRTSSGRKISYIAVDELADAMTVAHEVGHFLQDRKFTSKDISKTFSERNDLSKITGNDYCKASCSECFSEAFGLYCSGTDEQIEEMRNTTPFCFDLFNSIYRRYPEI